MDCFVTGSLWFVKWGSFILNPMACTNYKFPQKPLKQYIIEDCFITESLWFTKWGSFVSLLEVYGLQSGAVFIYVPGTCTN